MHISTAREVAAEAEAAEGTIQVGGSHHTKPSYFVLSILTPTNPLLIHTHTLSLIHTPHPTQHKKTHRPTFHHHPYSPTKKAFLHTHTHSLSLSHHIYPPPKKNTQAYLPIFPETFNSAKTEMAASAVLSHYRALLEEGNEMGILTER